MAAGDYPTWVYDPTGVNPPMFVKDDASYVALLNSPLPPSAIPGTPPQTVPPAVPTVPAAVAQPAGTLTSVGGTTVPPIGAKWTKTPTVGAKPMPVVVNTSPHVAGKR